MTPGETPPQSLSPHRSNRRHPSLSAVADSPAGYESSGSGVRFGGTCMCVTGPNIKRAHAVVQINSSSDGSGHADMRVPSLARKFCTIIS